jgi:peptidoglycan/xylan/chitin deacetylase (PgdA/CDA1 family)
MFRGHDASEEEIAAFLAQAVDGYLTHNFFGPGETPELPEGQVACYREADEAMREQFIAKGHRSRDYFAHRIYVAPRAGPDGMRRAQEMCDVKEAEALREILLYGISPATDDIAADLFIDKEIVWHGQQMGLPGLVATANLVIDGDRIYVTQLTSDLVQRIARAPEYRSRVTNRMGGWAHLLVNAALLYAVDAGARKLYFPTAELAMEFTAIDREVGPELFDRVYNRTVQLHLEVEASNGWWSVDVAENQHRVARLDRKIEPIRSAKTICICHDIERGLGHRDVEPEFVDEAERVSEGAILQMLEVESSAGIHTTYNLVGQLFPALRERITSGGHALAFHSYAHSLYRKPSPLTRFRQWIGRDSRDPSVRGSDFEELEYCRGVDYRLPGYRATMSRLTPGLESRHLAYFNFEWLASSAWSLGTGNPQMKDAIVEVPVHVDDFDLHTGKMEYEAWEISVIAMVKAKPFVAIGLHDCYGPHWLANYASFIETLSTLGQFATFDEVAERTQLASCRWL